MGTTRAPRVWVLFPFFVIVGCACVLILPSLVMGNLRDTSNAYDYVLLASDQLLDAALPLVLHRQDGSACGGGGGYRVIAVTTSQVFSEFSPGPEGIREFLSYAYHNWAARPKYVFLVGDADYEGSQAGDLIPSNYVFFDFGSGPRRIGWDDWFVCVDTDSLPKIAIGRLPARQSGQVTAYVNKVLQYEGAYGSHRWKNNMLFVAQDQNINGLSGAYVREIVQDLWENHTPSYWDRLAFFGTSPEYDTDGERKAAILAEINRVADGMCIITGVDTGADPTIFVEFLQLCQGYDWCFDGSELSNAEEFPLVVGASCGLGDFFGSTAISDVFLFSDKGAIGWIGPASLSSYQAGNHMLSRELFDQMFLNESLTIGEALRLAKINTELSYAYLAWPVREYVFLGDPALMLARNYAPQIQSIDGLPPTVESGTAFTAEVIWADRNGTGCLPKPQDQFFIYWQASRGSFSNKVNNTARYTAPIVTQATWDTVTVSVYDQSDRSDVETRRIYVLPPRPGGCPFLLAKDGIGYVFDNSILARSEGPAIEMKQDVHHIYNELSPSDGLYWLKIAEVERELSRVDVAKLIIIDYPPVLPPGSYSIGRYESEELHVGVTDGAEPFLYTLNAPPMIVQSSKPIDGAVLRATDGAVCTADGGDWVTVRFEGFAHDTLLNLTNGEGESVAAFDGIVLASGEKPDPCEEGCSPPVNSVEAEEPDLAGGLAVEVLREPAEGGWVPVKIVAPRVNMSLTLIELEPTDIAMVEKYGVRVRWLGRHKVDQIALYKRRDVPFVYNVLAPAVATHSNQSTVFERILEQDGRYVEIRPGEELTLGFPVQESPSVQQKRTFLFSSYGGYASLKEDGTTGVRKPGVAITSCSPNPFGSDVRLEISLHGEVEQLIVDIFDCGGRFITRIFDARVAGGTQMLSWDGRDGRGNVVKSGVYLCRTRFGKEEVTGKVVFIR